MSRETIEEILSVGGKSNSLGRVNEIITRVLADRMFLDELYGCMFSEDPWVRMRAADAFEKICREQPEWIESYIAGIQEDLSGANQQPSVQWHIAQIYQQVHLTHEQKQNALAWLSGILSSNEIDWIVAANCMKTLAYFSQKGDYPKDALLRLLQVQLGHKSRAVVKKADQLIASFA